ncbi:hypothetical protein FB566_3275 [Stackebrandtia endophytica]|uniref:Uncharacterized protein n=1 Tax=Stackebrandtia endophytica TaxID=1496996 RepID=A0A543AYR0_9ACTN|nr:hypothetical protein [Stackebrandtia endophytica]TQL77712.1 hypothetical protein FB566_3275 [Stackebrandtia endophytica]
MSSFIDRLSKMVVTTKSPDGTVTARADRTGTAVALTPDTMTRHGEDSLAEQVATAISAAYSGAARGADILMEKEYGRPRTKPDTAVAEARRRFETAQADLNATAQYGRATVTRRGTTEITVTLRPRTVGYIDPERISADINEAVAAAELGLVKAVLRLRKDMFTREGADNDR